MRAHQPVPLALLLIGCAIAIAVSLALTGRTPPGSVAGPAAMSQSPAEPATTSAVEEQPQPQQQQAVNSPADEHRSSQQQAVVAPPTPDQICTSATTPPCILAVYRGQPGDHQSVRDIPTELLIQSDATGRYQVDRGWRITVVTSLRPPDGFDRFHLRLSPNERVAGTLYDESYTPEGATFAFTVSPDDDGPNLFAYELLPSASADVDAVDAQIGQPWARIEFLIPTLRYHTLDINGAADSPGSYAFLRVAGSLSSAIENYGNLPFHGVELRINEMDAGGASRGNFFDTVEVGDVFDYRTLGLLCAKRFRVTSIGPAASPRVFGITRVAQYGGWCSLWPDDPAHPRQVEFVWNVGTGMESRDGIRTLLYQEPTGEGTYRLFSKTAYVLDVPEDVQISLDGYLQFHADPNDPDGTDSSVLLTDVDTGSLLHIDPDTGKEISRYFEPGALTSDARQRVNEQFDQIVASIRFVPVPEEHRLLTVCPQPADPTCFETVYDGVRSAYDQLDLIPLSSALIPDSAGRYHIQTGQQVTVLIAAGLSERLGPFQLQQRPPGGQRSRSAEALSRTVTDHFTVSVPSQGADPDEIVFDLIATVASEESGFHVLPGDIVATTRFHVPGFSYGRLDAAGEAAQMGSYAFLRQRGDAASAVAAIGHALADSLELVIHPLDSEGRSHESFYNAVRPGHTFDLRVDGHDCGFRFMITNVEADANAPRFGIKLLSAVGEHCSDLAEPSDSEAGSQFVWGLRAGADASGERPFLSIYRPNGPGLYRLQAGSPCVLEVPFGAHLIHDGLDLGTLDYSVSRTEPLRLITLRDARTHSEVDVDPEDCLVRGGVGYSGKLNLFERLYDSVRAEH